MKKFAKLFFCSSSDEHHDMMACNQCRQAYQEIKDEPIFFQIDRPINRSPSLEISGIDNSNM
jgi:hypothetical protein